MRATNEMGNELQIKRKALEESDFGLYKRAIRNSPEDSENIKKSSSRTVDQQRRDSKQVLLFL